jgi:hypothetical protein
VIGRPKVQKVLPVDSIDIEERRADRVSDERVVAQPPLQRLYVSERIVPFQAVDGLRRQVDGDRRGLPLEQFVDALTSLDRVVVAAGPEEVVATTAVEHIRVGAAQESVLTVPALVPLEPEIVDLRAHIQELGHSGGLCGQPRRELPALQADRELLVEEVVRSDHIDPIRVVHVCYPALRTAEPDLVARADERDRISRADRRCHDRGPCIERARGHDGCPRRGGHGDNDEGERRCHEGALPPPRDRSHASHISSRFASDQ